MAVPLPFNTTIDIYRSGSAPPAAPAAAAVPCHLKADWLGGQEHGEENRPTVNNYTHIALIDPASDIRETWSPASLQAATSRKAAGKVSGFGQEAILFNVTIAPGELLAINIAYRCTGSVVTTATPTFNGQNMTKFLAEDNFITLANGDKLNLEHWYISNSGIGNIVYDTSHTPNPATAVAMNGSIITGLNNIAADGNAHSTTGTSCGPLAGSNPPDYIEAFAAVNNVSSDQPNWSWQSPFQDANQICGVDSGGGPAGNFWIADAYVVAESSSVSMNYSGGTGGKGCFMAAYSQAAAGNNPDTVFSPNQHGTPFVVVFVERVGKGTPFDHKRAYLQRGSGLIVPWPSNDL